MDSILFCDIKANIHNEGEAKLTPLIPTSTFCIEDTLSPLKVYFLTYLQKDLWQLEIREQTQCHEENQSGGAFQRPREAARTTT